MISKLYFLLFILLKSESLNSQSNSFKFKNQIKFTSTRLIDIINPGLEFGYERQFSKKFATQLSIAYLKNIIPLSPYFDYSGFRISIEEKYYTNIIDEKKLLDKRKYREYVSGELFLNKVQFHTQARFGYEDYFDTLAYNYNYLDSFRANKLIIGFNLKYGIQEIMNNFLFDFSIGIGFKYRSVQHFDRLVPTDKLELFRHPNAFEPAIIEGNNIYLNIPFSVKFGYLF